VGAELALANGASLLADVGFGPEDQAGPSARSWRLSARLRVAIGYRF
jgi:hypothetical protein